MAHKNYLTLRVFTVHSPTSFHQDMSTYQGASSSEHGMKDGAGSTTSRIGSTSSNRTATTFGDIAVDPSLMTQSELSTEYIEASAASFLSVIPAANSAASEQLDSGDDEEDNQTSQPNEFSFGMVCDRGNVTSPASIKDAGQFEFSPTGGSADLEDSEEDDQSSHPNKYPVEIEYHENKYCLYKRQPTRSGLKVKQIKSSVYDPMTSDTRSQIQQIKYYQKDLVRICRCGKYNQMDGALVHGRANDCDGYEIHYSQKCEWKAYNDYKTGKRVLIRQCQCCIQNLRRDKATTVAVQPLHDPRNEELIWSTDRR